MQPCRYSSGHDSEHLHAGSALARGASVLSVYILAASVQTIHATAKIRPGDSLPADPSSVFTIAAARNEFEAFQVVIAGESTGLQNVRVSVVLPSLPPGNVRLYREGLLDLPIRSNPAGATGWWPDVLTRAREEIYDGQRNAFPMSVPAGVNRVVWVDILVPVDQPPGLYEGAVLVTGDGELSVELPFTLEVWGFTLPSTASLR